MPAGQREQSGHAVLPRRREGLYAAMTGYPHHASDVTSR
jgi:hypothetical protein